MSSRAGPGRATTALLAIVALVALVPTLVAPAAGAQRTEPGGRISLAAQTPWVGAGQNFEFRVDLVGIRQPEALEIVATLHEGVTSRSQFRQTLDGRLLGDVLWSSDPLPLPGVGLDAAGTIPFTIPLGEADAGEPAGVDLEGAGVHPVRVELRQAGSALPAAAFTTYLLRTRDDAAAPLAVAWVQGFAAPVALQTDGSVDLEDEVRSGLATIAAALAATDLPLTLSPRPETLDALGAVAPAILDQAASGLEGRQVLAGPYVDVPAAELLAAGLAEVVEAERVLGTTVVEESLGRAATSTWVSGGQVQPDVLAGLPQIEQLVVPEGSLSPLDRPLTLANPFLVEDGAGRRVETAAVDAGLAAHFAATDPVLGAYHLLADLTVLAYDSPGLERGVVVAPPPGWTPAADFLATALPGLAGGPVLRPVTLDQLFDDVPLATDAGGDPLVRTLGPDPSPPQPVAAAELRRTLADVASVVTMLGPSAPTSELLTRLALVSAAAELTPEEQAAYRAGVGEAIGDRLAEVGILSEGSFRLTSREATVPLTLVNELDTEVDVTLVLESDKLDFVPPAGGPTLTGSTTMALTLAPGRTPLMVPVEARASGDFPLLITLRSPDGRLELASTRLTIRSTFLSGVGLLLSVGAGLFLAGWWARHWRTARRDRRLIAPPA